MEKLIVKKEDCIGCGLCMNEHSDYFEFDENGLSKVIKEIVSPEDKDRLLGIVESCPTEAILIENEKDSQV